MPKVQLTLKWQIFQTTFLWVWRRLEKGVLNEQWFILNVVENASWYADFYLQGKKLKITIFRQNKNKLTFNHQYFLQFKLYTNYCQMIIIINELLTIIFLFILLLLNSSTLIEFTSYIYCFYLRGKIHFFKCSIQITKNVFFNYKIIILEFSLNIYIFF